MTTERLSTLTVTIEWMDGKFGGRVKAPGFLFTTEDETVKAVTDNLRDLIADYLAHEGRSAPEWQGIDAREIEFELVYELAAFFGHFKELKISAIAIRSGLNTNLLQQYVSGNKQASETQAKKIERAIHELANELRSVALV